MNSTADISGATPEPTGTELAGRPEPVAAAWHTIVFIVVILTLSVVQGVRVQTIQVNNRLALYIFGIAAEFTLVGYVWLLGLRPRGKKVRDLIGGRWAGPKDVARDIGIAILFWMVVVAALTVMQRLLGENPDSTRAIRLLSPQTPAEMVVWVMTSVSAGFCEEFLFRGYLQRQFLAWTGSGTIAIALQAAIFGAGHLYQGWKGAVTITVYGALFGVLAATRKSLRPGMIQHATQDSLTGLIGNFLIRHGRI